MREKEEKIKFLKKYKVLFVKIQRMKEMISLIPENKDIYEKEIADAKAEIAKIESLIKNVDDGLLSEILFQKYILCRSLEEISYEINYSKRQVERLHIIAVDKFLPFWKNVFTNGFIFFIIIVEHLFFFKEVLIHKWVRE